MPVYTYLCEKEHEYEEAFPVALYETPTFCPKCKGPGKRIIKQKVSEPSFSDRLYPYFDPALDRAFNSPSERRKFIKDNDYVERGGYRKTTKKQERMLMDWRLHNGRHKI